MILKTIKRMFSVGIAFVIFGMIDNGVMIISGSAIENKLGELFNLSTMASAGLGNTFSDIIGIVCGRYVEKIIYRYIPVDDGNLSPSKTVLAEAIGITCGCLLGMVPLYFI